MKRIVELTYKVEVEMDDAKFTDAFMQEFREYFFPFDSLDEHACHIADLEVREVLNVAFTEGYGPLKNMGINARVIWANEGTVLETNG